jgi:hypothetical protein
MKLTPESIHYKLQPSYLEIRKFTCLACSAESLIVVYQRSSPLIIKCDCDAIYTWDWQKEKFTNAEEVTFEII